LLTPAQLNEPIIRMCLPIGGPAPFDRSLPDRGMNDDDVITVGQLITVGLFPAPTFGPRASSAFRLESRGLESREKRGECCSSPCPYAPSSPSPHLPSPHLSAHLHLQFHLLSITSADRRACPLKRNKAGRTSRSICRRLLVLPVAFPRTPVSLSERWK
jgi:hypothetical protein